MGGEDDLNASIAHIVLSCVCGPCASHCQHARNFTVPGFHVNLFLHGLIGFLNFQGSKVGDVSAIYRISLAASRYLPIPCLMADITSGNEVVSAVHLISGLVPFGLALSGNKDPHLGNLVIAANIIALMYHAFDKDRPWAWYTAGAGAVAYFAAPNLGGMGPKVMYPLCLCLLEYCAHRLKGGMSS